MFSLHVDRERSYFQYSFSTLEACNTSHYDFSRYSLSGENNIQVETVYCVSKTSNFIETVEIRANVYTSLLISFVRNFFTFNKNKFGENSIIM